MPTQEQIDILMCKMKSLNKDYCFLESKDGHTEAGLAVINIFPVRDFDKFGCSTDYMITLIVPDFLHEEKLTGEFLSDYSWEYTREKMLELGFVERKWDII